MKRIIKFLILFIIIILLGSIVCIIYKKNTTNDSEYSLLDRYDLFKGVTIKNIPQKIIHAGGEIDGYYDTNSLEALEKTYDRGYKFIELDFIMSSDNIPICLHDLSLYDYKRFSIQEFKEIKIHGKYTTLNFKDIASWLKNHSDVYIITDTKEDNIKLLEYIYENYPDIVSHIIPQIYSYDEYISARIFGYSNIIFTLYKLIYNEKMDTKRIAEFSKEAQLLGVAVDASIVNEEYVKDYINLDVPIFVHTVNDSDEQQYYYDLGVTAIYTNIAD